MIKQYPLLINHLSITYQNYHLDKLVVLLFPKVLLKYPSSESFSLFRISNKKTSPLFTLCYKYFFFLFLHTVARFLFLSRILVPLQLEARQLLLLAQSQSFNGIQDKPNALELIQACRPLLTFSYRLCFWSPPYQSVVREQLGKSRHLITLLGSQT